MVFRDVSATRALTLKMSHLAQHDGLTDLPNRTLLIDRLDQAIVLARRHDRRLAVLFLDLDHFKRVNDSLGHVAGDRLLQSVAHRLLSCVRASDTVSRQGGDEFVILLSEITNTQDSATAAEKLLAALRTPVRIETHPLHATASIGIATYPEDGADAATLMVHADMALLHAKSSGRSKYQFFSPYMNVRDLGTDAHHAGLREPRRA
jgi:diguanylate cyclase (GGDEF)-like protein